MAKEPTIIRTFAAAAERMLPHHFDVVDSLGEDTSIPVEALSEDHSIGIYSSVPPRKMREHQDSYCRVDIAELLLQTQLTFHVTGVRYESYLEYVPLRGVRFRVEELQYLEQGWGATLSEVKYPTNTVLVLLYLVMDRYGSVFLYLNKRSPMPLWIRATPIGELDSSVQCAIQARSGDRMRPTNIHTDVTIEYARRWADGVQEFFERSPEPN
jgi:hypothetical protein